MNKICLFPLNCCHFSDKSGTKKMFDVKGKRAIVTGGSQGLGKEFTRRLLQDGCKVCIADVAVDLGEKTKQEFQKNFGLQDNSVCFVKCDVTLDEDWENVWQKAEQTLGGPIDILANNAGLGKRHGWQKMLDVMMVGATKGMYKALEKMGTSNGGQGGRIVNTASIAGLAFAGFPDPKAYTYSAAKAGLISMTRIWASVKPPVYATDSVKCYALAPWGVPTGLLMNDFIRDGDYYAKGKLIQTKEDANENLAMPLMTPEYLGNAFMKTLEYDKDGAVYLVIPNSPLVEYPETQNAQLQAVIMMGMLIGEKLGIELFTPKHFWAILFIAGFLFYWLLTLVFSFIF